MYTISYLSRDQHAGVGSGGDGDKGRGDKDLLQCRTALQLTVVKKRYTPTFMFCPASVSASVSVCSVSVCSVAVMMSWAAETTAGGTTPGT